MSDELLRGRFRAAAAEPSSPLDWPQLLERGMRRRKRRRRVPAVLTAAVVVATAVAVPLAVVSRGPVTQVLHGTPASPSWSGPVDPASHVPAGWQPVTYADVQVAVPAAWQVVDADDLTCRATGTGPAVALGTPADVSCPTTPHYLVWAQSAPSSLVVTGTPASVDGVTVVSVAPSTSQLVEGAQRSYLVPKFGVELTISARWARSVLATLSPSARAVVARPGLLSYTPSQWRVVQLDGVTLRVPPEWPLVRHAPVSCDDVSPWTTSEVDVGATSRRYCQTITSAQHFVAAVWVFPSPGKVSSSWGAVLGNFQVPGGMAQVFAGDPAATFVPVLVTPSGQGTPVGLWLGVGTDGALARDVLGSIQVTGP